MQTLHPWTRSVLAATAAFGLPSTEVSLEKKEAVVTFDDAKTSVDSLMKATANAGFPSRIKGN